MAADAMKCGRSAQRLQWRALACAGVVLSFAVTPALAVPVRGSTDRRLPAPRTFPLSGLAPSLRSGVGEARVAIALRSDPFTRAALASPASFALQGRLTESEVAALKRGDRALGARLGHRQETERQAALEGLGGVAQVAQRAQAPVIQAIRRLGGQIDSSTAIGNTITATVPRSKLSQLAARSDVASITPVPVQRPMGLDTETAAMGAPSFWSAGFTGGSGTNDLQNDSNGSGVDLSIEADKIQEDHPAFAGIGFERPPGVGTGTSCGSSTTGCEHGTAVASFAISRGASGCSQCVSSDASQKGIAPGLDHVLDNDTDSNSIAYDGAAWELGVTEQVWNTTDNSWHTIQGASDPAEVGSDSHGSYTSDDDSQNGQSLDSLTSVWGLTRTEPSGNDGQNGTGSGHITESCLAYDVICVGGVDYHGTTDPSDDTVASWSSQGPSPAGRKKPDIVANGQPTGYAQRAWQTNGLWQSNTWGTSYASPQVAGAAALLYGSGVTDPLAIKGVLLDSARQGRAPGCSPGPCPMATQSGWQPDWGWGELDLTAALAQRTDFAEGAVPGGSARFYRATVQSPGDRATLVWKRRVTSCVDPGCSPSTVGTLTNLDLKQLDPTTCATQAFSASTIDNVEQVRAPAASAGQQVLYDVKASSWVDGLAAEPFALAATRSLTPLVSPRAAVALTPSATQLEPGQDVTIQATVANPAPDLTADQASVTLDLPAGVELVSGEQTQTLGQLSQQGQTGDQATATWVVRATTDGTYNLTATTDAQHCGEHFAGQGTAQFTAVTPQSTGNSGTAGDQPGTQPTSGPLPVYSAPALLAPHLRIARKRWTSRGLKVTGAIARGATGRVTLTYNAKHHGKRTRVRKTAAVRAGRFSALLRVRHDRHAVLTVEYPGTLGYLRQTVRTRVR